MSGYEWLTTIDGCGNAELKACMECGPGCGSNNENCGYCEKPYEAYAALAQYEGLRITPKEAKSLFRDGGIELAMHNRELQAEISWFKAAEPREEVKWFAEEMEKVLRENDHKGGWNKCDDGYLAWMLKDNLTELCEAAFQEPKDLLKMPKSAVDIANYAMMIVDNVRKIGGKENEV